MGLLPSGTALSERPPWVPAWDELAPEDQKVAARFMECFAAFLSYTDAQIGRLLEFLRTTGDFDNTLVVLVSDNGASSEGGKAGSINDARLANFDPSTTAELRARIDELGGPSAHNNYPWGWTMAGNTPFKRWKREVHEGGVADPCIVHWPARLGASAGGIRHQFTHAIDVTPTVLELIGLEAPEEIALVPNDRSTGRASPIFSVPTAARRPGSMSPSISRCSAHEPSCMKGGRPSPSSRWPRCTTTG